MIGIQKWKRYIPYLRNIKPGKGDICKAPIAYPEVDAIIELLHGIWVALRIESVQSTQGESAHTMKG